MENGMSREAGSRFAGKKVILSAIVIFSFAGYAMFVGRSGSGVPVLAPVSSLPQATVTNSSPITTNVVPTSAPVFDNPPAATAAASQPTKTATAPKTTPAPAPAAKPAGQYADGQYTGSAVDNDYGTVQVQAVISGGKLANVNILQYPNDRGTSRQINGQAMPYLVQEAIQAQNANVDIVSGATQSSEAFQQSLASALVQAKS